MTSVLSLLCCVVAMSALREATARVPAPIHQWEFDGDCHDSVGSANCTLVGGATIAGGRLVLNGGSQYAITGTVTPAATVTAKTFVSWITLSNLDQRAGSPVSMESPVTPRFFDAVVYAERQPRQWMASSDHWSRSPIDNGGDNETVANAEIMIAIVYEPFPSSTITIYRNGSANYTSYQASIFDWTEFVVVFGRRTHSTSTMVGSVGEVRIYDVALTAADIADIYNHNEDSGCTASDASIATTTITTDDTAKTVTTTTTITILSKPANKNLSATDNETNKSTSTNKNKRNKQP